MKILWVCNIVLPIVAEHIGAPAPVVGGWLTGISNALKEEPGVELIVSFPATSEESITGAVEGISYCSFYATDMAQYRPSLSDDFYTIIKREQPDVVHIFGTEFPHALSAIEACEKAGILNRAVVSIQGMVSIIGNPLNYYAALPNNIVKGNTIRDIIKRDNVKQQAGKMLKRGEYEMKTLQQAVNVIGRTDWDKACTQLINPRLNYHFCNETLRDSFYDGKWDYDHCEKHSIFVSQCSYPIKGFHMMLEAMQYVVKKYPDVRLYTTGPDIMAGGWWQDQKKTYYRVYLKKKIKEYGLEDKVTFLGFLTETQMKERMLKSNVFVSPSSIENSPNSVGEAMILGVPCISSDVGGVKNMLKHGEEGLVYPFHDPYVLAHYIDEIFSSQSFAEKLSYNAKQHAETTHSQKINLKSLIDIYNQISLEDVKK